MPTATTLHPRFAARVTGIDICQTLSASDPAWLRDALDHWPVLVLAAPAITDHLQVASSKTFGTRAVMHRATVQCPPAMA
jgi:alpha-ketoglutarate-dependent taurine dioxygenase